MSPVEIETIKRYVAAFVAYEFCGRERDSEGYGGSCVEERQALEQAEREMDALSHPMFK